MSAQKFHIKTGLACLHIKKQIWNSLSGVFSILIIGHDPWLRSSLNSLWKARIERSPHCYCRPDFSLWSNDLDLQSYCSLQKIREFVLKVSHSIQSILGCKRMWRIHWWSSASNELAFSNRKTSKKILWWLWIDLPCCSTECLNHKLKPAQSFPPIWCRSHSTDQCNLVCIKMRYPRDQWMSPLWPNLILEPLIRLPLRYFVVYSSCPPADLKCNIKATNLHSKWLSIPILMRKWTRYLFGF